MATREEIEYEIKFMMIMFPNWFPKLVSDGTETEADVWYAYLKDIDAGILHRAVKEVGLESGRRFHPSIGELIDRANYIIYVEGLKP